MPLPISRLWRQSQRQASRWVILADEWATLDPLRESGWTELKTEPQLWTDQRSSLWSVLIRQTDGGLVH
jgi:hypothetical protein